MTTKLKILEFTEAKNKVRAEDIRNEFDISRAMVHKHLLSLQRDGLIFKTGKPPIVYYSSRNNNVSVTDQILEKIKSYNPKKVILFGSQAYGTPDKDSDYDIAIIKDTNKSYRQRLIDVRSLVRMTTPIDFFVFTNDEIEKYKKTNPMIKEIVTKGKVLYEQ